MITFLSSKLHFHISDCLPDKFSDMHFLVFIILLMHLQALYVHVVKCINDMHLYIYKPYMYMLSMY